ncbi:MAG TPA: STAS/SEC14 domain-containing protein [Stenotrophomonas sp.]|jgi:hypothetical protein
MYDALASADHVGAYRFTGTLTREDYDRCIADVEQRLTRHGRIGIYCEMAGFTGLTLPALGRDLEYAVRNFGRYDRFARAAIVTPPGFVATMTSLSSHFLPDTEVRVFAPDEGVQALAWATDFDPDQDSADAD